MYKQFLRPILFSFEPEKAHHITFWWMKMICKIPLAKNILRSIYQIKNEKLSREIFGIKFPNPVGLAAGLDKNALLIDEWENVGFGFVEIGTVTPLAQPGNEQARLFRLPEDKAIINRMGFNNDGMDAIAERLKNRKSKIIIGGNIGKNKITPNENAVDDYIKCFNTLYAYVDYFVVNVSSPNTPGLRALQDKEPLMNIMNQLQKLNSSKAKRKPLLLKIAPDLTNEQLNDIIEIAVNTALDGLIATNTTISRENLTHPNKKETGGMSGAPLKNRSTEVVKYLHQHLQNKVPIIASGGVMSSDDAIEKLNAGAALVQVYTGFIYEGPALVKAINQKILSK
jgi:dihydroorotate dehydrogenase